MEPTGHGLLVAAALRNRAAAVPQNETLSKDDIWDSARGGNGAGSWKTC